MLVPPGLCACSHEHVVRIDSETQTITETIVTPEPTPVRHHCHHHKQPAKPAELPQPEPVPQPDEPIPDHSHDPFCPAVMPLDIQPPTQQLVVSSDLLPKEAIATIPWVCTLAIRNRAHDPCRALGSPPIYISHCALLI